ncbi:C2HC-type zinc finger protein, partial [Acinetobacter baumannii]|uniref:C2HC-type zinc finger protein n=1 Tax=Acinetobacter baumannii TaxID=470 RepID=UPI003395C337
DTCHKCGKAGHFIRKCPLLKAKNKEYQKQKGDKEKRRDLVVNKNDQKAASDYVVKKALAAWGDSSSNSENLDEPNDVSMVVVHEEETIFNEMFAFMAHSEYKDDEDKVTILDMKHDLHTYSLKN